MKLLRVEYDNVCVFEDNRFTLDLFAQDKVPSGDESVTLLGKPIYSNSVIAIAGVNASGKSIALSLIDIALRTVEGRDIFTEATASRYMSLFRFGCNLRALLWHQGRLYLYHATFINEVNTPNDVSRGGEGFLYAPALDEETLSVVEGKLTKAVLSEDFEKLVKRCRDVRKRSDLDKGQLYLLGPNKSMLSAQEFRDGLNHILVPATDPDFRIDGSDPEDLKAILRAFDPGIISLGVKDGGRAYTLRMSTFENEMVLSQKGLEEILSSGTVKGLAIVQRAVSVLRVGGYLLLDEIENHLNKQLVNVLIDLFTSRETNPNGATLVFSTHYPEVLDHLHRKDNVFFLARQEDCRSMVVKYSDRVSRIENKKSEVFASNYIKGTAPRYSDVKALQGYVRRATSISQGDFPSHE